MHVLFIETLFSGASIRGEPLGILQLSSVLKTHGHQTRLVDLHSPSAIQKAIREFKPDILAYSLRTGFHRKKFEINRLLKQQNKNIFSIFGGVHATFFPECIHEEGVDVICIGDGEEALLELCDHKEGKSDITTIRNLWVKEGGHIYRNSLRPPIKDLDTLPFLDRELLYAFNLKRSIPIKTTITLRGCPFSCSYCYSEAMRALYSGNGNYVRRHSPQRAIAEIEHIRRWGNLKYLIFEDDIFTYDRAWLVSFAALYKKHVAVPFWAYTHVRYVDKDTAELLREAQCHMVGLGVESASCRVRKEILNRDMQNSEIEHSSRLLRDAKIRVCVGNILGIPGSSLEDDIETLRLNAALKPEFATASMLYPFPGTRIARFVEEKGYKIEQFENFVSMRSPKSVVNVEWKTQAVRLQLLFLIVVRHPQLLRYIRSLISLPLNGVYYGLAKIYKIFTFIWIIRLKLSLKELAAVCRMGFYYLLRNEV